MAISSPDLVRAAHAYEHIYSCLSGCTCSIVKADIGSRSEFDRVVALISAELEEATIDMQEAALEGALSKLTIDWAAATAARRELVLAAAMAILPPPEAIAEATLPVFSRHVLDLIASAMSVQPAQLSLNNDYIASWLRDGNAHFITAAFAARNDALNAQARAIVARGLQEGWPRADMAAALEEAFGPAQYLGRSANYWDIVAGVFAGRARAYGNLQQFTEAGITRYRIEATMDEVTCDACRFLHGKTFTTASGVSVFERMANHPEAVKDITPFLRIGSDAEGNRVIYVTDSHGTRRSVATVWRSAVGTADDRGAFRTGHDENTLAALGLCVPPFHGHCRCMMVADV